MSGVQRGLGRGIGALIPGRPADDGGGGGARSLPEAPGTEAGAAARPGGLAPVPGASFAELPVSAIRPNARQPRSVFDEDDMAELVASIKVVGLLQPVVVRAVGTGAYELIMGERRWRAVQAAGLSTIAAIVRDTSDDGMLRDALLENLHRSQLNPLEEAAAYQQLLDDFGCTHEELATRLGRSRPHVSNTLRLLRLSPHVQRRLAAGVLSAGHARALLGVDAETVQDELAGRVVAEGISVRGLEELVTVGRTTTRRRKPAVTPAATEFSEIAARLSEQLETRCQVVQHGRRGRIVVEFADLADLQRIEDLLT